MGSLRVEVPTWLWQITLLIPREAIYLITFDHFDGDSWQLNIQLSTSALSQETHLMAVGAPGQALVLGQSPNFLRGLARKVQTCPHWSGSRMVVKGSEPHFYTSPTSSPPSPPSPSPNPPPHPSPAHSVKSPRAQTALSPAHLCDAPWRFRISFSFRAPRLTHGRCGTNIWQDPSCLFGVLFLIETNKQTRGNNSCHSVQSGICPKKRKQVDQHGARSQFWGQRGAMPILSKVGFPPRPPPPPPNKNRLTNI